MFKNKTILITGGTGSLGTALSKYLLTQDTKKIIIFSRGWLAQKNLRDVLGNPSNFRWFIGDIRDRDRLNRALRGVDILLHAAAIKCIDACNYNPSEAMLTNVVGAQNAIDAAIEQKVNKCLFISTDKAVNAINTYGKTKALAESLWINANKYSADDRIKFSVCRYGNVVGSAGSVVPVFLKLIEQGTTELPITDERMTRFWFPMQSAIDFVCDSLGKMQGGEIFIPRIPSIRIVDLAKAFDMPYKIVGIREGEKLHEELEPGYDSGSNPHFLTVEQIKQTIGAIS